MRSPRTMVLVAFVAMGLLSSVAPVGAAGDPELRLTASQGRTRTWESVDLWQATVRFPKGWVMIDYTADELFPAASPVVFQLTNYDPVVRRRPACVGGHGVAVPDDGVILSVGSGAIPSVPPDPADWETCPVPLHTETWQAGGVDYWAAIFGGPAADTAPAFRALKGLVFPPDGAQDTPIWAWEEEPVVILGTGEAAWGGKWALSGGAKSSSLSFGTDSGGGGSSPNECPVPVFGGHGWGRSESGKSAQLTVEGLVSTRVAKVTFVNLETRERVMAKVFPVPPSLYGGKCNVFGLTTVGNYQGWGLPAELLAFNRSGKLIARERL